MKNQRVALVNSLPWLFAALMATLWTSPVNATDISELKDETRIDGTRTLGWTWSRTLGERAEVLAGCLFIEASEHERVGFWFRWPGVPAIKEGEAILLQVAGEPIREYSAKMANDGWIQVLSAVEVISQLIGKDEYVIGVRGASGQIVQRNMDTRGLYPERGRYDLEVFKERCLNPDKPRAKKNIAAKRSVDGSFELGTVENGDLVLIYSGMSNLGWGFRCLAEPQTSQGHRWGAGMIVMIDAFSGFSSSLRFDDEPQEIAMSRAPSGAEYPGTIYSSRDLWWSKQDATPILERALESDRVTYERRSSAPRSGVRHSSAPAGVLDFEVFLARARRLGCNNEVVEATKAPAPRESRNQTPTLITTDNIPFIYESRAEVPAPAELLFPLISQDYRRLRSGGDEFALRDLADRLQPVLERRLLNARDVSRVTVKFGSVAGEYDFERSGFPTSFSELSYVPYASRAYAIKFSNSADLSFVPVAESVARELSSSMRRDRGILIDVTGSILSAEETSVGKTVLVRAEQVDIALKSGRKVGTLQF